jgi:multidrug efflux pump subunit AcrB
LIEGALLACLVVFLILRDWRATLIAAAAIPLSIFPTFAGIEILGFTLNMVTLIALALVTGVLVDDAIVEIENIIRHMRMGKSAYAASLEAADEIGLAVVATTGAIIAVFVPVSFMEGGMGVFFKEFGLTVALAAFFSLVVARLITPMMAAFFLKNEGHEAEAKPGVLTDTYHDALAWSIRNPWKTIGVGLAVFIVPLGLLFAGVIPAVVIPRFDNGMIQATCRNSTGHACRRSRSRAAAHERAHSRKSRSDRRVHLDERRRRLGARCEHVHPTDAARRTQSLILRDPTGDAPDPFGIPGLPRCLRAGPGRLVWIRHHRSIRRPRSCRGERRSRSPRRRHGPGSISLADVRSTSALRRPEIQVRPRQEDMARLGVTSAALASAIRIATSGDAEQNLPKFDLADRQIPIRVTLRP